MEGCPCSLNTALLPSKLILISDPVEILIAYGFLCSASKKDKTKQELDDVLCDSGITERNLLVSRGLLLSATRMAAWYEKWKLTMV